MYLTAVEVVNAGENLSVLIGYALLSSVLTDMRLLPLLRLGRFSN